MQSSLQAVLEYVEAQEDRYYEFAAKAMVKGNVQESIIHSSEASAFQRVRYFIEDMMNGLPE